jgi:hypothetical protein
MSTDPQPVPEIAPVSGPPAGAARATYLPPLGGRIGRGILVALALVVAAGFVLICLPQSTLDKIVRTLQASKAAELPSEKIALLYLGDDFRGKEFHIRGIVRNISADPLEKVDATIRLYSVENYLLETILVRADAESITPDGTAEFHLVYPDYKGQFGSYSVDFKFRGGEPLPYKDRRGARQHK